MLKRSRTDEKDGGAPRRLLIAATSDHVRDTYGGLLAAAGFDTVSCALAAAATAANEEHVGCAVLVGTGPDEGAAIAHVDEMRHSDHQHVRRTAVLLLASSARNQIFACESGIDGLVVLPAHLEDIVAAVQDILARPRLERYDHRQAMLAAAREP